MEDRKTRQKVTLAVVMAGLVGFLLAPPIATAHRGGHQNTEIHHGATQRTANVTQGRVHTFNRGGFIDVSDSFVFANVASFGRVMATGDGTATACNGWFGGLSGVTASGTGSILVTGDLDFDAGTPNEEIWRGQTDGGTVESNVFGGVREFAVGDFVSDEDILVVEVDGTLDWIVYGWCFDDSFGFSASEMGEMRRQAQQADRFE